MWYKVRYIGQRMVYNDITKVVYHYVQEEISKSNYKKIDELCSIYRTIF